jgi:hypothetical protein
MYYLNLNNSRLLVFSSEKIVTLKLMVVTFTYEKDTYLSHCKYSINIADYGFCTLNINIVSFSNGIQINAKLDKILKHKRIGRRLSCVE